MSFTAAQIANHLKGEVVGDNSAVLTGFAPASTAKSGDLTFAENGTFFASAEQSAATAILVAGPFTSKNKVLIRVANARVAFAQVLPLFFPEPAIVPGIHPTAVVASSAQIDDSAHVGPHCVIGERTKIGPRVVLQGGVQVGDDCLIGEESRLFPRVVLYAQTQVGQRVRIHAGTVVGADGFGYVFDQGIHLKIPQVGRVIIQDDVEIGANVTIDRGALGPTIVGRGTKIDNLVQVGHNVVIGEHCLLVAQVGVAGSSKLGNYVTLAGQVGIIGHINIGNRVLVAGKSGVIKNIPDGTKCMGSPAQPDRQAKRQWIALQHLPDLLRRVSKLEKQLAQKPATLPSPP